jgi:hypothetical protein
MEDRLSRVEKKIDTLQEAIVSLRVLKKDLSLCLIGSRILSQK